MTLSVPEMFDFTKMNENEAQQARARLAEQARWHKAFARPEETDLRLLRSPAVLDYRNAE